MKLLLGNCLEVMKSIPENSVDAVVTDPPYELGFMGKSWDASGIANNVNMWKECLRVLKPGGHLLSFGGTRTYHRMACAIEDAGFEIRDMIEWVYGSGFPKSLNIGKAVDALQGNKREDLGTYKTPDGRDYTLEKSCQDGYNKTELSMGKEKGVERRLLTKGTSEWEGWGTALKPAHEPICMARKPLSEKTVAENVLKYGTGGINVDESRVELIGIEEHTTEGKSGLGNNVFGKYKNKQKELTDLPRYNSQGRFPSNLIHDNSEEVRECFPESNGALAPVKKGQKSFGGIIYGKYKTGGDDGASFYGDNSGSASRFFKTIVYQPKASKSERNEGCEGLEEKEKRYMATANGTGETSKGMDRFTTFPVANNHPTVKPVALMEYLIKMVSREHAVILDPFMGSGTTGIACAKTNREFIGIEMEPEYMEIANKRIEYSVQTPVQETLEEVL